MIFIIFKVIGLLLAAAWGIATYLFIGAGLTMSFSYSNPTIELTIWSLLFMLFLWPIFMLYSTLIVARFYFLKKKIDE